VETTRNRPFCALFLHPGRRIKFCAAMAAVSHPLAESPLACRACGIRESLDLPLPCPPYGNGIAAPGDGAMLVRTTVWSQRSKICDSDKVEWIARGWHAGYGDAVEGEKWRRCRFPGAHSSAASAIHP